MGRVRASKTLSRTPCGLRPPPPRRDLPRAGCAWQECIWVPHGCLLGCSGCSGTLGVSFKLSPREIQRWPLDEKESEDECSREVVLGSFSPLGEAPGGARGGPGELQGGSWGGPWAPGAVLERSWSDLDTTSTSDTFLDRFGCRKSSSREVPGGAFWETKRGQDRS